MFEKGKARKNGVGRVVTKDNQLYEGMIADGYRSGFGRLILPTGEHYIGYFKDDLLHGLVALFDIDNNFMSCEIFVKGKSESELEAAKKDQKTKEKFAAKRFEFNVGRAF